MSQSTALLSPRSWRSRDASALALGDVAKVRALLEEAGFASVEASSVPDVASFPTLRTWVDAEVKGWVGGGFSEEDYESFFAEAERTLAPWVRADGRAEFTLPAVLASGRRDA